MKTLVATLAMAAIFMMPLSAYAANTPGSEGATGSVTISGTCGISLNATTIAYGSLAPNTDANATNHVGVTDTGNVAGTLLVGAGNWTDINSIAQIDANETFVNTSPVHVANMTTGNPDQLSLDGAPITVQRTLSPQESVATYWALITKLLNPVTGNLTQSVTFTTSC